MTLEIFWNFYGNSKFHISLKNFILETTYILDKEESEMPQHGVFNFYISWFFLRFG